MDDRLPKLLIGSAHFQIYEFRDTVDFYCQHGPKECRGNMIHTCVLNEYKHNHTTVLPFVECMEYDLKGKPKPNVDQVARDVSAKCLFIIYCAR